MNAQTTLILIFVTLLTAACTESQIRKVGEISAGEIGQKSLVAFSIDDLAPFEEVEFDIVRAERGGAYSPLGQIAIDRRGGAEQLLVYEMPAEEVQFGLARFRYDNDWWESVAEGPAISAAPGRMTYIGKFQLQSFREGVYHDSGRKYPARVNIVIVDASGTDMPRLVSSYPSLSAYLVNSVTSEEWADYGNGSLRFVPEPARAGRRKIDYFERTVEPTEFPPRTTTSRRDQNQ